MKNKKAFALLLGTMLAPKETVYSHNWNMDARIEVLMTVSTTVPDVRKIYVDEEDNIIKIMGNSKEIPYKNIQILKQGNKIKMNAKIAYQYDYLSLNLDFKKSKVYHFNSTNFSLQFNKYIQEKYGILERHVIEELGKNGNLNFPCSQIVSALKKSEIYSLKDRDTVQINIYPDEKKGDGYENISLEKIR